MKGDVATVSSAQIRWSRRSASGALRIVQVSRKSHTLSTFQIKKHTVTSNSIRFCTTGVHQQPRVNIMLKHRLGLTSTLTFVCHAKRSKSGPELALIG